MDIIKAENIKVKYRDQEVISNLNISIKREDIVTIIGPNGSGKTTILKVLSRNLKPDRGQVYLQGKDIATLGRKTIAKQMAVLSQTHYSPKDVNVKQLVTYGRFAYKKWWKGLGIQDQKTVEWALETTGLQQFAQRRVSTLSGGEKQRVWLAMAIAQKPDVLLLDEPTTYLDICHQLEILELVYDLNQKEQITVVMVLHDINHAARYSDEIIVLKDGDIFIQGSPGKVMNSEVLSKVFRVEATITTDNDSGSPVFYPRKVL
jgi:iron complex transport system ATP-binding protein